MDDRQLEGDLDRIWTVPNALSVSRIFLVGFYLFLLFGPNARVFATIVLAIGGITDFADGYIARRFDQVTTLGKMLDPTADRILLGSAISSMIVYGAIPLWLAGVVLFREVIVTVTVLVLASRGAPRIDVSQMGKAATFGFMVGFPLLLLGHGPGGWAHVANVIAWIVTVPSLGLSYGSAVGYVPRARRAIAERRQLEADRLTRSP